MPQVVSAIWHCSKDFLFMQSGSQFVGGGVVQGSNPELHMEQEALHCACHQASELEHICQTTSASLHSLALLISWQVPSHFAIDCDVVSVTSRARVVVDVAVATLVLKNVLDVVCDSLDVLLPGINIIVVVVLELGSSGCVVENLMGLELKPLIEERTKEPELVNWLSGHAPSVLDPGRRAAHFSSLSLIAQFASDM